MRCDASPRREVTVNRSRTTVRIFTSFEEENRAEHRRLAEMTPEERCSEFAVLQERVWGDLWTSVPMKKVATWESRGRVRR
jgi:hypothetical protein